jgi:hypothetical protein
MAQPTSWWCFWNRGRIERLNRPYRQFSSLYLDEFEDRVLLDGSGLRIIRSPAKWRNLTMFRWIHKLRTSAIDGVAFIFFCKEFPAGTG